MSSSCSLLFLKNIETDGNMGFPPPRAPGDAARRSRRGPSQSRLRSTAPPQGEPGIKKSSSEREKPGKNKGNAKDACVPTLSFCLRDWRCFVSRRVAPSAPTADVGFSRVRSPHSRRGLLRGSTRSVFKYAHNLAQFSQRRKCFFP